MSLPEPPVQHSEGAELDRALQTFFRRAMPDPWPTWQPPARPRRRAPNRSRLALATALALLLAGLLSLAGRFRDGSPSDPGLDQPATAHRLHAPKTPDAERWQP
jgi:hypothetical protein